SPDERAAARAAVRAAADPLLKIHGFSASPEALVDFIATAIAEREWAKFAFTRNLSDALLELRRWGESADISAEDLSFADVRLLSELYASAKDPRAVFRRAIAEGREHYRTTEATCLPPLIRSPAEVWSFRIPPATPNFVTARAVRAHVANDLSPQGLA